MLLSKHSPELKTSSFFHFYYSFKWRNFWSNCDGDFMMLFRKLSWCKTTLNFSKLDITEKHGSPYKQGTIRLKCSPLPMGKNENGKLYFLLYRISDIAHVSSTYFLVFVIFFELSQPLILICFTFIFYGYNYYFFFIQIYVSLVCLMKANNWCVRCSFETFESIWTMLNFQFKCPHRATIHTSAGLM